MRIALAIIGSLSFALPGSAQTELPNGKPLPRVDFERHVMGLFGKAGCNNGSCHGSFQGKNGFRLSLFGYEPARDYAALTREVLGRRIDRNDPDQSLLLLKATGAVKHDGGVRISRDSWQYGVIRSWIEQGAKWEPGSGTVKELIVEPKGFISIAKGEVRPIKVSARFADGSVEDITPFCDFRIQDDAVAAMVGTGSIRAGKPGDSGLTIAYRGNVAAARILVPTPAAPGFAYPATDSKNFIDREVRDKLKMLNVLPSAPTADLEFLRRVTLDTIGCLPTPDEARAFAADTQPDKRERKIDELLKHPLHAALWALKFSDITGNNTTALEQPNAFHQAMRSQMWQDWLRKRFADNVPYDKIVKGILTATSLEGMTPAQWIEQTTKIDAALEASKPATKGGPTSHEAFDTSLYTSRETLDLFWRRQAPVLPEIWGEKVAAAFLGIRLECAQCHKHPTDRWTQADYRSFANFFSKVNFNNFSSPELKKIADAINTARVEANKAKGGNNGQVLRIRELYVSTVMPKGGKAQPNAAIAASTPKALGGPEIPYEAGKDIRVPLFEWMASKDNPYFARSFANRVWAHYLGVGIVDPADDFSVANPPSNGRLLDALARDFADGGFDIRRLEKAILMSDTYQTSSVPNETNKFDRNNFARAYVRPLIAEVVVDTLNSALDVSEQLASEYKPGSHLVEIGANTLQGAGNVNYALRLFGRSARTTACDCERSPEPALPQTLFRMTDSTVMAKLNNPKGRLARTLKEKPNDADAMDEIFLATLTRLPTATERADFMQHLKATKTRAAAFTDLTWALINTREFVLNH